MNGGNANSDLVLVTSAAAFAGHARASRTRARSTAGLRNISSARATKSLLFLLRRTTNDAGKFTSKSWPVSKLL
jgi:hypothetical protein